MRLEVQQFEVSLPSADASNCACTLPHQRSKEEEHGTYFVSKGSGI